jgi:hypothetical protein
MGNPLIVRYPLEVFRHSVAIQSLAWLLGVAACSPRAPAEPQRPSVEGIPADACGNRWEEPYETRDRQVDRFSEGRHVVVPEDRADPWVPIFAVVGLGEREDARRRVVLPQGDEYVVEARSITVGCTYFLVLLYVWKVDAPCYASAMLSRAVASAGDTMGTLKALRVSVRDQGDRIRVEADYQVYDEGRDTTKRMTHYLSVTAPESTTGMPAGQPRG